jgi:hypothetical protein
MAPALPNLAEVAPLKAALRHAVRTSAFPAPITLGKDVRDS